jgi:hypothetical protein
MHQRVRLAGCFLVCLSLLATPALPAPHAQHDLVAHRLAAVAGEVEDTAARTRPSNWPLRRACLYYALAGQYVLARKGIPSSLRRGTVVYAPGGPSAHRISPHAWLETATHFVDYATLPRWGRPTIVSRQQVATAIAQVEPGDTAVLALSEPIVGSMRGYIAVHRARLARQIMRLGTDRR